MADGGVHAQGETIRAALETIFARGQIVANVGQPVGWWCLAKESEIASLREWLDSLLAELEVANANQQDRDEECEDICALLPGEADGRTLTQYIADSLEAANARADEAERKLTARYNDADLDERLMEAHARLAELEAERDRAETGTVSEPRKEREDSRERQRVCGPDIHKSRCVICGLCQCWEHPHGYKTEQKRTTDVLTVMRCRAEMWLTPDINPWLNGTPNDLASDVIALLNVVAGLSADVARLEADAETGWAVAGERSDALSAMQFRAEASEARVAELRSALEAADWLKGWADPGARQSIPNRAEREAFARSVLADLAKCASPLPKSVSAGSSACRSTDR